MTSPTQRSLKKWRDAGWTCAITERWNQFAKVRQDLFGFADLVVIRPAWRITAVQTTSGPNLAARIEKIRQEPKAAIWLAAGGRIIVEGWRKVGPRGKRKTWECREIEITNETSI